MILDTITVLIILYTVPRFVMKRSYVNASLLALIILALIGIINGYGYHVFFKDYFKFNAYGILAAMVEHARSYGILAIILAGKKFYDFQIRFERLEKFKATQELQLVRSQINPHFLFNTLNNIYSLIEDKDKEAAAIVSKLSELLRFTIYDANKEFVPLRDELTFIQGYFRLEQIRHDNPSAMKLKISGDPKDLIISPAVLISFVENAFKHGINSGNQNWVNIEIMIQQEIFQMHLTNSFTPEYIVKNKGGVGLSNAKRHLQLQYPDRHQLDIEHGSDRYDLTLTIELDERTN